MRDMPSKFVEILDFKDAHPRISDSDVRLEDVLADHEAIVSRPASSTHNSSKTQESTGKLVYEERGPSQDNKKGKRMLIELSSSDSVDQELVDRCENLGKMKPCRKKSARWTP
ncbi:hypothetical protein BDW74DRAFT_184272 [Aspergillus multicolor]|uniref:uncharacterized protein n=1 Tax=Aspergillus multicolor TaxID=41759 RepID=UPI003CCCD2E3